VAAPVGALGGGHHTPRETIDTTANINSLSGYLVGDDGREVDFSILSNGSGLPSARVREAFDDVAHALQGRRP
jgi:D-alanyl-D-alanine carboxypeptidase